MSTIPPPGPSTSPTPAPPVSLGRVLVRWPKQRPREAIALLGLVVSLVLLAVALPRLASFSSWSLIGRNAGLHVFSMAWILAVTIRSRSITIRHVVAWWLVGFFPLILLNALLQGPIAALVGGSDTVFITAFWVPIVEEVTKALPLALVVALGLRARWSSLGPTDLLVLGFALGAGFAFHEEALWARSLGTGFAGTTWGALFPGFADFRSVGYPFLKIGHVGWAAVMGASFGGMVALRWFKQRWGFVLPLVALGLVSLDHVVGNYLAIRDGTRSGTGFVRRMLIRTENDIGFALAMLLLLAVVGFVVLEVILLRRAVSSTDPPLPTLGRGHLSAALGAPTVADKVLLIYACVQYQRHLNAACYATWATDGVNADIAVTHRLHGWGRAAGIFR